MRDRSRTSRPRRARALFLAGRYEECVASIQSRFRNRNFDSRFWLGGRSGNWSASRKPGPSWPTRGA